jgi:putative intracellular protease/amidase
MSVQHEVTRALASPQDFIDVQVDLPNFLRKTLGLHRDSASDARSAWVVRDGNYVSARWPGDAFTFAATFAQVLESQLA